MSIVGEVPSHIVIHTIYTFVETPSSVSQLIQIIYCCSSLLFRYWCHPNQYTNTLLLNKYTVYIRHIQVRHCSLYIRVRLWMHHRATASYYLPCCLFVVSTLVLTFNQTPPLSVYTFVLLLSEGVRSQIHGSRLLPD